MTPKPDDGKADPPTLCVNKDTGERLSHPPPGEEVVISGMAGYFPNSDSTLELQNNLFNKVDLVTDDHRRWKLSHPEIPQRTGKLNHVNRFDASFFGVHFKQAHTLDPMCRMLLECTYSAIIDAGVNPRTLKNTKTAVFVGGSTSESEKTWFYEKMQVNGFGITGCSRAMLANRISYWLGTTGPSYAVDTACSSSTYALEHAYKSIRDGHCEMAIVGGSQLCLHPYVSLQFSRLGVLSTEGRCRSFDEKAAGYARSEAIVVVFLQKAKNARRVYSQVLHAKTNCDGYKEQGITYPAGNVQKMLLKSFYQECGVNPADVEFVEAHATGTRVGDPEELKALDEIFCSERKVPLKIGSIKSNIGHTEPASGLCSVIKMCLAYYTGYIPPNLNYESPRDGVDALKEGRMVVVTDKEKWNKGLVGINSFGFGGANAHVLLKNFAKPKKNNGLPDDNLPRLVCVSGRSESAVNKILLDVETRSVDVEQISLLHAIHECDITGHIYRGYTLVRPRSDERVVSRETIYFPGTKRPIWFVFSGMGSQWAGMGKELMDIPIFARAITKCDAALKPKGLDIIKIITDPDPKIFHNILHSFVGIAAIQIGLCDVLKEIGVVPDHIIGHSVGELGCAYADECFTAEQMILAAYYRGLASIETPFIRGSMAAVGLGYQQVKTYCPNDIEIACHNGPDSSTVSGPAESMKKFVANLQSGGIFAKEVPCSNIAYHSKYIAEAGPTLLKYLKQVIPNPKPRSAKWVSSSVPKLRWDEDCAKYSSAEYHTNNLLSPVLFEETSKLIQHNAVTVEIAPHGLLQAILRRSLKKDCTNVALTKKGHPNNVEFMLTSIGKLYEAGVDPKLTNLYPKVQWPVSAETPMISPLVEWIHNEDWFVTSYSTQEKIKSGERTVRMTIVDEDMEYMAGHVVDGRNLYPATGYLVLVWETLAMMRGELYTEVSVVFENVRFIRATHIPRDGNLEFVIMIQKGSGKFEVMEGTNSIVTGEIRYEKNLSQKYRKFSDPPEPTGDYVRVMNSKDVYKELRLRGYDYSGIFKGIESSNISGTTGHLRWINNWVTFLDAMLQMKILTMDTRILFVPTRIAKLSIDSTAHYELCSKDDEQTLPVNVYNDMDIIRSGGVEIRGLNASGITKKIPAGVPVLEQYEFMPYFPKQEMNTADIVRCYIQILLENVNNLKVKAIELLDYSTSEKSKPLMPLIVESLGDMPLIQAEALVISNDKNLDLGENITVDSKKPTSDADALLFVGSNLLERSEVLQQALACLNENGFIISREELTLDSPTFLGKVNVIGASFTSEEQLVIMKPRGKNLHTNLLNIPSSDTNFSWMESLKKGLKESERLILVSQKDELSGILGLTNCLKREPNGDGVGCITIMDNKAPEFKADIALYKEQIDKKLAINVLKNGQWGTYRHLKLKDLNTVPSEHAYVNSTLIGDLSSFRWIQGPLRIGQEKQLVHIYYAALNFREIMLASGRLSLESNSDSRLDQEFIIGMEYAGRTESGARVMGIARNKAMANIVVADKSLLWPIPEQWTIDEGATIPIAYATVYYAFFIMGNLIRGSKVLIHAGSGGVGQAAINVCLHYDCEIFTTVGTPEKKAFIKKMFPQLKDSHIGNSRDTSFEEMIRRETNGAGVQYVLNSLADDKLLASVRCLSYRGQFLEIGKFDLMNNTELGMSFFLRECSFRGIMLDQLFISTLEEKQKLGALLYDGIKEGCVKPLVHVSFNMNEVEKAYRYMAAGKHIGKVLVKIRDEEPNKYAKPTPLLLEAIPRYLCYPECTYIVIGGLGGFGLELADWLIVRGARKIVLNSRRGVTNGYQSSRIRVWKNYGTQIVISTDDITTQAGCENLLKSASALGPVRAIFNLAVILKDSLFENQTPEMFETSFAPKARATKLLDIESRKYCPNLKDFVVFSSVVCGRGNAGQTNYGMANSIMERICEERKKSGYPGLAVQWGAVGEVGLVADMQEEHMELEIGGTLQQKIGSCLRTLDIFLNQSLPIVASMVVAEKRSGGQGEGDISGTIASIMGIKDIKTVSPQMSLAELGMDSIMSVEIKQTLERDYDISMTPQDIRALTFAKLSELSSNLENEITFTHTDTIKKPVQDLSNLMVLMRNIGDELTAAEPTVNMASQISNKEYHVMINEIDPRIFMIPGIEGMAAVFENLSKRIKSKVTVLQLNYDNPHESLQDIAYRLVKVIKAGLYSEAPFTILGYSFGVVVAMEIVKILEADGHIGTLICMDGAPEVIQAIMRTSFNTLDENVLQDTLLNHIMELLVTKNKPDISSELAECDSWETKLEVFLKHVPEKVKHSKQYQRALATVVYSRLKLILSYDTKNFQKFKSGGILLRPKESPGIAVSNDYGLSEFFENPLTIHTLDCNHMNIVDNKDCANIINRAIFETEQEKRSKRNGEELNYVAEYLEENIVN